MIIRRYLKKILIANLVSFILFCTIPPFLHNYQLFLVAVLNFAIFIFFWVRSIILDENNCSFIYGIEDDFYYMLEIANAIKNRKERIKYQKLVFNLDRLYKKAKRKELESAMGEISNSLYNAFLPLREKYCVEKKQIKIQDEQKIKEQAGVFLSDVVSNKKDS